MTDIPVTAESPSAATEPFIVTGEDPIVSWRPERGWMCEEHLVQPCEHTADLEPVKNPDWEQ